MLLRARWFLVGFLTACVALFSAAAALERAREQLTPQNLARSGARGVAAVIDAAADRIAPFGSEPRARSGA